jgi:hypothetical protein
MGAIPVDYRTRFTETPITTAHRDTLTGLRDFLTTAYQRRRRDRLVSGRLTDGAANAAIMYYEATPGATPTRFPTYGVVWSSPGDSTQHPEQKMIRDFQADIIPTHPNAKITAMYDERSPCDGCKTFMAQPNIAALFTPNATVYYIVRWIQSDPQSNDRLLEGYANLGFRPTED